MLHLHSHSPSKPTTTTTMEDTALLYSSIALLICLFFAFKSSLRKKTSKKQHPPSPFPLPIIGHLHLLKHPIHRALHSLSQKYGPIFSLRLGSCRVLVVSSPAIVEECFTKNDIVFANRPDFTSSKYLSYDSTTLGAASYGDHWRTLRRLTNLEIFSSGRLNTSFNIRKDEIKIMLGKLNKLSGNDNDFAKIGLKSVFKELTLNITVRMIAGKRYYGEDVVDQEAKRFRDLISDLFEFTLASYPGDIWPIMQWFDFTGYKKKASTLATKLDKLFQDLIDESRRNGKKESETTTTMITHLLTLQETEPEYYSDRIIKGLIMTMVLGGTDTSSVTLEWAMSNLLNHPHILNKARVEIDTQIGTQQLLQESDLPKLTYLKCIILETLRLYPAGPLLLPHKSSADCTLSNYHVKANTILLVNAWAMQRDPKIWNDPTSFKPERFENRESEAHKLMIAFGLGRRSCPGMGLAHRVLGMTLGSLIQCFDWQRIGDKEINMDEGQGISMPKAEPLVAFYKPREIAQDLLIM